MCLYINIAVNDNRGICLTKSKEFSAWWVFKCVLFKHQTSYKYHNNKLNCVLSNELLKTLGLLTCLF